MLVCSCVAFLLRTCVLSHLPFVTGRKGLGKDDEDLKRKTQRLEVHRMTKRKRLMEESLKGDFKSRMKDKLIERQTVCDVYKSQKACEQLDVSKVNNSVFTSNDSRTV